MRDLSEYYWYCDENDRDINASDSFDVLLGYFSKRKAEPEKKAHGIEMVCLERDDLAFHFDRVDISHNTKSLPLCLEGKVSTQLTDEV